MKALVIGGTRFVGAAIVDELREKGWEITVFSRGETNPEMFTDVSAIECVRGDRKTDLGALGARRFDAVFDSCGYTADAIAPAANLARGQGAFYVFVSTGSVYEKSREGRHEASPIAALDSQFELTAPENYGAAKALCEAHLRDVLGEGVAIARAGLIVGPRDYTDRFPYWVKRFSLGGKVLCPGDGSDPTQLIDARDLAGFVVSLATSQTGGVYNVTGPRTPKTFADLLAQASTPTAMVEPVWASAEFLEANDVSPWAAMPLWLPREHEASGILSLDIEKALASGLELRPWAQTAADTLEWLDSLGRELPFSAGLSPARESELIAKLA